LTRESAIGTISSLCASSLGVFRMSDAIARGASRNQIAALKRAGVIERVLPGTYRMTAVARSHEQSVRAALLWAGPGAAAAGRSAAEVYRLEGVQALTPEIVVPREQRLHSTRVIVHRPENLQALMIRQRHGLPVTGIEATLVALGAALDPEALEVACEDARRR
jgi:predicted transcriptional regulator of viral defense system